MRLDDPQSEHPKFKTYVDGLRALATNDAIVKALTKFGKMPDGKAAELLGGDKPVLWVFKDVRRSESIAEFPNRLLVPFDMVTAYEADDKSAKTTTRKGRPVVRIGVHI